MFLLVPTLTKIPSYGPGVYSSTLAYLKENFPLKVAFGGGLFHLGWSKWHLGTRPSWGQWSRWGTSPRSWSDGNPRAVQDLRPKREKKIEK